MNWLDVAYIAFGIITTSMVVGIIAYQEGRASILKRYNGQFLSDNGYEYHKGVLLKK